MADWDPKRAHRIDRSKKQQRENKKIDSQYIQEWDQDIDVDIPSNRRNKHFRND